MLPQIRSSLIHGVKSTFCPDGMKLFKNIRILAGSCTSKHAPNLFTVLQNLFVWMLCSHSKTFKLMVGPRSPTSPVTAQLVLRHSTGFFSWCYADFQQRSKERLVLLPQTRPSSFHGVEELFRLDVMQIFRKVWRWRLGRAPQHPLSRPNSFHGVKLCFRFDVMQTFISVKWTAGRTPPSTVQLKSRCWINFSSLWREAFQKHSKLRLGRAPPNTAQFLPRCWKVFSYIMQPFRKHSSWWLGRASQHPLSRPSSFRGVEDSFRFDVMQTFNNVQMNGWSCSPKHGPAKFTALSQLFVQMAWNFSKTFDFLAGSCFPKHGPISFTTLPNLFVSMLCSHFKNFQVGGWAALPNIPCHGPAHFTAVDMDIVLMLRKPSTKFKWTAGRAPQNTVQLNSRCWVNFSSGWHEVF